MNSGTNEPAPSESFRPRAVQLAVAVPSLLLWTLLAGLALVWFAGLAFRTLSGMPIVLADWRFAYLVVMLSLVVVGAVLTVRTQWRAYKGRSSLWWHGATLGMGLVFFVLLGIVGD